MAKGPIKSTLGDRVVESSDRSPRDWLEFAGHAQDWKRNRRPGASRADELASHPSYQRIIGMGPRAVPCILRQLHEEMTTGAPDHWFWALWAITGATPVPERNQGNVSEMAQAWIDWGEREGYFHAEGLGGAVPATGR